MATAVKVCHVCAADVSQKKRTKDSKGRYYCEACYKAQHAKATGAAVMGEAEPPAAAEPRKSVPVPAEDDGLIELADDLKKANAPAPEQAMFACLNCKKIVPEKQIRNDDGEFVCLACFAKRRQSVPSAMPRKSSFKETVGEDDENRETWKDTLAGGAIISGGVVLLTFVIFLMLNMFVPPVGKGAVAPSGLHATVLAIVQTVFVVVQAGMLLVSMVLAARLLGGIDFGYIGSALWKSLALVLAFSILSFFSERSEALGMLSYALNGLVLLVAFVVIFKIDFFEAMILSAVNFLLFFVMAIALGAIVLSLRSGFRGGADFDDEPMEAPAPLVAPGQDVNDEE
jgi:hypothetical protein